jgi:hypothetical protein
MSELKPCRVDSVSGWCLEHDAKGRLQETLYCDKGPNPYRRPEPTATGEAKAIKCEWIYEDPKWGYGKAMSVIESNHPRFTVGSRFDYGFMSIANGQGYTVTVLPVPAALSKGESWE